MKQKTIIEETYKRVCDILGEKYSEGQSNPMVNGIVNEILDGNVVYIDTKNKEIKCLQIVGQ